jgi:hypothetical protein
MTPAAKKPAPRLGDIPSPTDLCGRVDRMDNVEQAILRIERKVDLLVASMTPAKKGPARW